MSQTSDIRAYLNTGRPLTSMEAFTKFGITRLAARVCDLRHKYGDASILTEYQSNGRARWAVYHGTGALK